MKKWILIGLAVLLLVAAGGVFAQNMGNRGSVNPNGENGEVSYRIEGEEIVLSWGEKPTGGYAITVEETEIKEGDLYVYYSLRSPGPEEMVPQVITYPEDKAEIPGEFEEVHLKEKEVED